MDKFLIVQFEGGVVGDAAGGEEAGADGLTAISRSGCEESVIVPGDDGKSTVLSARLASGGELNWVEEENRENAFSKAIATSQMTSMLRDSCRMEKYRVGIERAVHGFVEKHGRRPVVLDIGAGTGLLSMMAARAGAAKVVACELFEPLCRVAGEVVEVQGGFGGCEIVVVPKRSTKLEVGKDLEERADILVTEIFDSALVGEGCVPAIRDAWDRLLQPDAVVVPRAAQLYGVAVEAREHGNWRAGSGVLGRKEWSDGECRGGPICVPVHGCMVRPLTVRSKAFELGEPVSFQDRTSLESTKTGAKRELVEVEGLSGRTDAVLVWWELDLDGEGDNVFSTCPRIELDSEGIRRPEEDWQDHWVQCLAPLSTACTAPTLRLDVRRSDTRISIDLETKKDDAVCVCGLHSLRPPSRVRALCDVRRQRLFQEAAKGVLDSFLGGRERIRAIDVGYDAAFAMTVAEEASNHDLDLFILDLEPDSVSELHWRKIAAQNGFAGPREWQNSSSSPRKSSTVSVCTGLPKQVAAFSGSDFASFWLQEWWQEDEEEHQHLDDSAPRATGGGGQERCSIDLWIADPYHAQMTARPTWTALSLWQGRLALSEKISAAFVAAPSRAVIQAVPISSAQLSKCHGLAGSPSDFSHAPLDAKQEDVWFRSWYPYPLWQYEHDNLSAPSSTPIIPPTHNATCLAVLDFVHPTPPPDAPQTISIPLHPRATRVDAIAVWVDYEMWPGGRILHGTPFLEDGSMGFDSQEVLFFPNTDSTRPGLQVPAGATHLVLDFHIDLDTLYEGMGGRGLQVTNPRFLNDD